MCRSGTGRGGGCTHCSRAGRWPGCGSGRGRVTGPRQRGGPPVLAGVGGLDHRPRPCPRRRRPPRQRGSGCWEPDHHALGRSRGGWGTKTHAAVDARRGVLAFTLTPGQAGDSPEMIAVLAGHPSGPSRARATTQPPRPSPGRQGLLLPRQPGLATHHTGSRRPSPSQPTKPDTASIEAQPAAHPPPSTPNGTRTDTPSNAPSATSNTTAASPPATTSSPSATPPPSTSPASTTGSEDFRNRT